MWFQLGAATLANQLRAAENRLLSFASRFLAVDDDHRYQIEQLDTLIPRTAVPLKEETDRLYPNAEDESSFILHSLHVTSDLAAKTSAKDKSDNEVPLVLLHGYMNGAAYFYRNLVGLSQSFESIYSLDLLGWGLSSRPKFRLKDRSKSGANLQEAPSPRPSNLSQKQNTAIQVAEDFFVESLEAWRKARGIQRMILAGHSMGGYISVAYSERYPQHVERLVLISPVAVPKEESAERQERFRQARENSWQFRIVSTVWLYLFSWNLTVGDALRSMPTGRGRGLISRYVGHRLPSVSDPDEQEALIDYLYYNNVMPGSGEYCVNRFLTPFVMGLKPTEERIPKLKVKSVSFLYGSNDWMDISGGLKVQARCLDHQQHQGQGGSTSSPTPNVNVYQVSKAGHLLMLDNWQEFNAGLVLAAGRLPLQRSITPQHLSPQEEHYVHRYHRPENNQVPEIEVAA